MKLTIFLVFTHLLLWTSSASSEAYIVVADDYPPYQYLDKNGQLNGLIHDTLEAVLNEMGHSIHRTDILPWKRALLHVKNNKADILISANLNPERLAFGIYPEEPFIISPWYLWVKDGTNLRFDKLDDLQQHSVGVVQGYTYTEEFWQYLKQHRLYFDATSYNDEINLERLDKGTIDYAAAEFGNGLYLRNSLSFNITPLVNKPIKEDGLYALFSKSRFNGEFVNDFSNALKRFKSTRAYKRLCSRYYDICQ